MKCVQVLKMIDEYDLYGSVAYPKAHNQVRFLGACSAWVACSIMMCTGSEEVCRLIAACDVLDPFGIPFLTCEGLTV